MFFSLTGGTETKSWVPNHRASERQGTERNPCRLRAPSQLLGHRVPLGAATVQELAGGRGEGGLGQGITVKEEASMGWPEMSGRPRKGARITRAEPLSTVQVACDIWVAAVALLFMSLRPVYVPDLISSSDLGGEMGQPALVEF